MNKSSRNDPLSIAAEALIICISAALAEPRDTMPDTWGRHGKKKRRRLPSLLERGFDASPKRA